MSDSAQAAADKKTLNRDRIKFGVAGPLYSGDESAFSPLHTAIIRSLGGSDIHLGIMGAVLQSVAGMFSWIGAVMLRLFKFNRKAMVTALCLGALVQVAIVGTLLVSHWNPAWASVMLICYLFLPLWGLVWFEVAWRSGRVALMAFSTAYLLDHFGMRMDRIILIHMIVNVVNIATLYIVGHLTDKIGIRGPLAVISGVPLYLLKYAPTVQQAEAEFPAKQSTETEDK